MRFSSHDGVSSIQFGHWGHLHINIYKCVFHLPSHPIWQTFQAILKMADWADGLSWKSTHILWNCPALCANMPVQVRRCRLLVQWVWCVDPYTDCGLSQGYIHVCTSVEVCSEVFDLTGKIMSLCSSMPALSPTADVVVINSSQSQDLLNPVRILTVMFFFPPLYAVRCLFITVPVVESSV